MTEAILGYMVNNFLIDSKQYNAWQSLGPDELKSELKRAGIMSDSEFDDFNRQLEECSKLQQI